MHRPQPGDPREILLVASPRDAKRAEGLLKSLGHENFFCYVDPMDRLPEDLLQFPKVIRFRVRRGKSRVASRAVLPTLSQCHFFKAI